MIREEDIDVLLASWDDRLRRVDENLLALEGEPTYQMLSGGGRTSLTGSTRERVVPALDALGELFEHRERLNAVVVRAKELKGELSFWNKDDKLAEIAALLGGPSITLGTRQMPVAQRSLLDPAASEVVVNPAELLGEMVRTYQIARDVVADVSAAWARLEPKLLSLECDVAEVQRVAASVGEEDATSGDVRAIVAELARIRKLVSADPLGASGTVDADLGPRLSGLRGHLADLAAHKANVARGLAEADAIVSEIQESERAVIHAVARATREIAGFDAGEAARSAREEVTRGLGPWREKIATAAAAAHWKAADVGLARWLTVARGVLNAQQEVVRRAKAAEETRTELEGRLSARRAQASALTARGHAPAKDLDQIARTAEATLHARPTDLERAGAEVESFEAAVRLLAGKGRASS